MPGTTGELAFIATLKDEASRHVGALKSTLGSIGGTARPVVVPVSATDRASAVLASIGAKAKALGGQITSVGTSLTTGLTLPIAGAGVAIGKTTIDFSRGMGDVASLLPGNTERIEALRDAVMELGVESGTNLNDVSRGLYQTLSAFGDTADTAKILATNVEAARAGAASVPEAIALTSAVTKAYGDTSAAAVRQVADLGIETVRLGQTTLPELAASIGAVTPLTKALGIEQTELFGVMSTFTGVTGGASEVATQLRGVLQSIMAPTDAATKAIERGGFASGEALVKQEGLAGATEFLVDAAKRAGVPLAEMIPSIEGQTIALGLAGPQAKAYADNVKELGESQGATKDAFEASTTGVGEAAFAWDQAKTKAQALLITLGEGLGPAVLDLVEMAGPLVDKVSGWAEAFANADPAVQKVVVVLGALLAAAGPVLVVAGKLVSSFGTVAGAVAKVGPALGNFGGGTATAATGMQKFAGAARMAAGAGGLLLLADGLQRTGGAVSALEMGLGGMALGAMFGPGGMMIGGIVGTLGGLAKAIFAAGEDADIAADNTREYAESLNGLTGAVTGATRALVAKQLLENDVLDNAKELGISTADVVSATMGQAAATNRVGAALHDAAGQARAWREEQMAEGTMAMPLINAGYATRIQRVRELGIAIGANRKQIRGEVQDQQILTEAVRGGSVDTKAYAKAISTIPKTARTSLETLGADASKADVRQLLGDYKSIDGKKVETILEALGFTEAKTKIESVKKSATDLARRKYEAAVGTKGADEAAADLKKVEQGGEKAAKQYVAKMAADGIPTVLGDFLSIFKGGGKAEGPYTAKVNADTGAAAGALSGFYNSQTGAARSGGASIGAAMAQGISGGLQSQYNAVAAAAAGVVSMAMSAARARADIQSPSRVAEKEVGKPIGQGIAKGIEGEKGNVGNAASKLVLSIIRSIADSRSAVRSMSKDLAGDIESGFDKEASDIRDRGDDRSEAIRKATEDRIQQIEKDAKVEKRRISQLKLSDKEEAARLKAVDQATKAATKRANDAAKERYAAAREVEKRALADIKTVRDRGLDNLKGFVGRLSALADQRDAVEKRLAAATENLRDLEQARADTVSSIRGGILSFAEVVGIDTVNEAPISAGFIAQGLEDRLAAIRAYQKDLAALRDRRVSASIIKQLEAEGVEGGGAQADALANATKAQLDQINATQAAINDVAGDTAQTAASHWYDAGIDAAEGIVKGIRGRLAAVDKVARELANRLRKAVRKALRIHSPSRALAEDGREVVTGLAEGILGASRDAEHAARTVADRVRSAAAPSLSDLVSLSQATASRSVVRTSETVTIRHVVESPDGSVSNLKAREIADMIASDPRSAKRIEAALRPARVRHTDRLISASLR